MKGKVGERWEGRRYRKKEKRRNCGKKMGWVGARRRYNRVEREEKDVCVRACACVG